MEETNLYNDELLGQMLVQQSIAPIILPLLQGITFDREDFSPQHFICTLAETPVIIEGQTEVTSVPALLIANAKLRAGKDGAQVGRTTVSIPIWPDFKPGVDQHTYDLLKHRRHHARYGSRVTPASLVSLGSRAASEVQTNPESVGVRSMVSSPAGEGASSAPTSDRRASNRTTLMPKKLDPVPVVSRDYSEYRCSFPSCNVRSRQPMDKICHFRHCTKKTSTNSVR